MAESEQTNHRVVEARRVAEQMIRADLGTACRELREWHHTGLLSDGLIEQVGQVLSVVDAAEPVRLAEQLIVKVALERCAEG